LFGVSVVADATHAQKDGVVEGGSSLKSVAENFAVPVRRSAGSEVKYPYNA
jgi:hypothetical protein